MADAEKTGWDKAAIILQPLGGLFTALAVAFVGILGSNYLNRSQEHEAKVSLYTQLMSQREASDTALRQEMFKSIVGTFLTKSTAQVEQKLLSLELLAYNFHESLELSPLFKHVRREVETSNDKQSQKVQYLTRLEDVAKEVAGKQIEILEASGTSRMSGVDLEEVRAHPEGKRIFDECFPLHAEEVGKQTAEARTSPGGKATENPRCIRVDVLEMDQETKGLKVLLLSTTPEGESVDQRFWVDFYDLPMVDNTHLSHDERVSVVLREFTGSSAQLALVYFPGSHAGLKDKPFYDDMLHQLELEREPGDQPTQH
jgi:hypothetical protein